MPKGKQTLEVLIDLFYVPREFMPAEETKGLSIVNGLRTAAWHELPKGVGYEDGPLATKYIKKGIPIKRNTENLKRYAYFDMEGFPFKRKLYEVTDDGNYVELATMQFDGVGGVVGMAHLAMDPRGPWVSVTYGRIITHHVFHNGEHIGSLMVVNGEGGHRWRMIDKVPNDAYVEYEFVSTTEFKYAEFKSDFPYRMLSNKHKKDIAIFESMPKDIFKRVQGNFTK